MKLSTKIILPIILISAMLILLTGCFSVPTDESPGFTPGTITGIIAAPCCENSAEPADGETTSPEYWCFYCEKEWKLQDGVEVVLTYGEDEVATTTTDENGVFTFTDVFPGKNYVITALCPEFNDDSRPLVKDVALELVADGSFDTKITDIVSTSLGLVVDFIIDFTILGPEDIVLDEVVADKPDFKKFPKFRKLITEVVRVLEACQDVNADDDLQYALCRAAEEISKLTIGCGPGYTPPPPAPVKYTLTTKVLPVDSGKVTGAGTYNKGVTATVIATPEPGWQFDKWTGNPVANANLATTTILMNSNKSVEANFTQIDYTLAVEILPTAADSAGCDVTRSSAGPYNYGDVVTLTPAPAAGWAFDSWSGTDVLDIVGAGPSYTITMNSNKSVEANFTQIDYTLAVEILPTAADSAGCDVTRSSAGPYNYGDVVTLTPAPAAGWAFDSWSGTDVLDIVGAGPSYTITMNSNKSVEANFTQIDYTLAVEILPTAADSAGCDVTRSSAGPYNYGDVVTLTPAPAAGWAFDSWSGTDVLDIVGAGPSYTITMNSNKSVEANFTQIDYTLAVEILPTAADSAGCDVTRSSAGPYNYGDVVTLTPAPAAGWAFDSWSGTDVLDIVGAGPSYTITMNSNKSVEANFTQIDYTLAVEILPTAADSAGCDVTRSSAGPYNYGDVVTLTPAPAAGWAFDSWSGTDVLDIVGAGPSYTITMNSNKSVEANFTQIDYTLAVEILPTAADSAGCDVTRSSAGPYNYGDVVTLTPAPAAGWAFDSWSGTDVLDIVGAGPSYTITMNSNKSVEANFTQIDYTLAVEILPTAADSAGCDVTRSSAGPYNYGDVVTLTPAPAAGWAFDSWSGTDVLDIVGAGPSYTITMNSNKSVEANFTQIDYTLAVEILPTAADSAGCDVTRSSAGPYNYGDVVTLTPAPAAGWAFDSWSGTDVLDIVGAGPSYTITMNSNKSVEANFTQIDYTLAVEILPTAADSAGCDVTRSSAGPYNYGDVVTLTPAPAAGWAFDSWSGTDVLDIVGAGPSYTITMNSNKSVEANFVITNVVSRIVLDGFMGQSCTGAGGIVPVEPIPLPGITILEWLTTGTPNCKSVHFTLDFYSGTNIIDYRYTTDIDGTVWGSATSGPITGDSFTSPCIEIPMVQPNTYATSFDLEIDVNGIHTYTIYLRIPTP